MRDDEGWRPRHARDCVRMYVAMWPRIGSDVEAIVGMKVLLKVKRDTRQGKESVSGFF